jgi:phage terminase small subunit
MCKLTDKQAAFIDHYLMCLNATEAAARAHYQGNRNTLAAVGRENLRKPKIREEIDRRLNEGTMKADEILFRLGQHAEGLPPECFDTSYGQIVINFDKVKELGLTHLIKKVSYNAQGRAQTEIYDAQAALVHLGKYHALFTDKVKHEDWRDTALEYIRNREVSYEALVHECGPDLATELFKLAGVPVEIGEGAVSDIEE